MTPPPPPPSPSPRSRHARGTCLLATPPAIYGEGFVKPICRFKSMEQKSARLSPSPSASVDLPHLSRRPAGVCAFCRISLEPEAEGDRPTASGGIELRADVYVNAQAFIRDRPLARTSPGKINP